MKDSTREENGNVVISKKLGYRREFVFPNLLKVHVPSLSYEAFDQDNHMHPWSLLFLMFTSVAEDDWYMGEDRKYLLHLDVIIDDRLYDTDSPKLPLVLEYTNKFVSNSSRGGQITLHHPGMPKPYAVLKFLDVNIDPVTRKSKPFPDWWREKYRFPTSDVKQMLAEQHPPEDGRYMTNHRIVRFGDIDGNNHMSYTMYVRFCYESLLENIYVKKCYYGADGMSVGKTREIRVFYKSECLVGDELTIKSWKDNASTYTYHFEMWKENKLVANVTLAFFNPGIRHLKVSKL